MDAVLVDRSTVFGNPFVVGRDGDRYECVGLFQDWVLTPERAELRRLARALLAGRDLVCHCAAGEPCHALVWLEVVAAQE